MRLFVGRIFLLVFALSIFPALSYGSETPFFEEAKIVAEEALEVLKKHYLYWDTPQFQECKEEKIDTELQEERPTLVYLEIIERCLDRYSKIMTLSEYEERNVWRNGSIPSVSGKLMIASPSGDTEKTEYIGYVKIKFFSSATGDELEKTIVDFLGGGINKIAIDLRDNDGGILVGVLESLYYFSANPNDIMVREYRRDNEQKVVYSIGNFLPDCHKEQCASFSYPPTNNQKYPGRFKDLKVAILINRRSASGSELFAGTMKDWGARRGNVVLVGERTHGKGVGQEEYRIKNDFVMVITAFEYFVGNSEQAVHAVGVIPHHIVYGFRPIASLQLPLHLDEQLKRAISFLVDM